MYQAKETKLVNILSGIHMVEDVPQDGSRNPERIQFYKKTKVGGDRVDQNLQDVLNQGWMLPVACSCF